MAGLKMKEIMYRFNLRYMDSKRAIYRTASDSWMLDNQPITITNLRNVVTYDLEHASMQRVGVVLAMKGTEMQQAAQENLVRWAKRPYSGRDAPLRHWVELMQREGCAQIEHEAHMWALKQWMWQVKRHVLGLPVTWHVVPIFWSRENGTGKSFNVQKFFAPLQDFSRTLNVYDVGEKFSTQMFARTLVGFFDEFAGADEVNRALLKSIISGRPLEGRAMYSESGYHAPNRMSFIATSNMQPPHGFEDDTGARRFWSIHCNGSPVDAESKRGKLLDAIVMQDLWDSVCVSWPSIYDLTPPEVRIFMEECRENRLRQPDSFEQFTKEHLEFAPDDVRTPVKAVLDAYRLFCLNGSFRALPGGQDKTAARLTTLGYICTNCANRRFLVGHRLRTEPYQS